MLGLPINQLTLLKTVVFVLNFKLWPPLINAWPPKSTALPPALFKFKNVSVRRAVFSHAPLSSLFKIVMGETAPFKVSAY